MAKTKIPPLVLVPPLLFVAFAAVAYFGLIRDNPNELPSALIGSQAPSLERVTALRDDAPPTDSDLRAPGVKLVNFWASWCGPCRVEHPFLTELAENGTPVIGLNYKDQPENAVGFLDELGDPYQSIGADEDGRTGLDWGIYGVPETFVVADDGSILLRHPGPLTPDVIAKRIAPLLDKP